MIGSRRFLILLAVLCLLHQVLTKATDLGDFMANSRDLRTRRGFKNAGLATARGFGKRTLSSSLLQTNLNFPYDESATVESLVDYLQRKPEALRAVVERCLMFQEDGEASNVSSDQ